MSVFMTNYILPLQRIWLHRHFYAFGVCYYHRKSIPSSGHSRNNHKVHGIWNPSCIRWRGVICTLVLVHMYIAYLYYYHRFVFVCMLCCHCLTINWTFELIFVIPMPEAKVTKKGNFGTDPTIQYIVIIWVLQTGNSALALPPEGELCCPNTKGLTEAGHLWV